MKAAALSTRSVVLFVVIAVACQSSIGQTKKSKVPSRDPNSSVPEDKLPSYEEMLAAALKHHPEARAAQAELDRVRLKVATEIRAFREEWRAAKAILAEVKTAQREFDRISPLQQKGIVPGRKVLEVEHALEVAQRRAASAEAKLKEMRLLLPHLLGAAIAEKSADKQRPGHTREADDGHSHGHHAIPAPVEKLLRERLKVLAEIVKLQQAAYKMGEANFDNFASAQLDLFSAQLELAKSTDERVKIRQETVRVSRQIEEAATKMFRANQSTRADMLKATALRLRAEADLKREQLAAGHHH